jgi:hypothetical protein
MSEAKVSHLTRIGNGARNKHGHPRGIYRCGLCGAEKEIVDRDVKRGHAVSCGCIKLKAGGHRKRKTKEYTAWKNIIARCLNPKHKAYKNYGARGVMICDLWRNDFLAFLKDVGSAPTRKHTIDRIGNNGNYEPGNTEWSDWKTQERNRRSCRFVTHNGERLNMSAWAERFGVTSQVVYERIKRNGVVATFNYYLPTDGTPTIDHGRENQIDV